MAASFFLVVGMLLTASLPAQAALTQDAELALDRGLHCLYNLDYAESRRAFRKIIEQEPDNPFGYLFESGAIWWQAAQEYDLFKDTPTLQGLFEQDVEATIRKSQPWIDSKDKTLRVDGYFAAGLALGTRGQWHLMKGHYVKAYLDGKRTVKHIKKSLKLDDTYYDAYIGLGIYDYQAARLSGVARLGSLIGVRGDEKRGLERIQLAADRGRYGARQAAQFLSGLYILDRRDWAAALPLIERLRRDFPDSVYFDSIELLLRWRLGQPEQSLAMGRAIFERIKKEPRAFNRKLLTLVCGLQGEHCLDGEQAAGMRAWLTAAIAATPEPEPRKPSKHARKAPPEPPTDELSYLMLLHLYRGYMADVLGRTDEATTDYAWVLKQPDFSDSRARASSCLETGCPAKELLDYLHTLSHSEP